MFTPTMFYPRYPVVQSLHLLGSKTRTFDPSFTEAPPPDQKSLLVQMFKNSFRFKDYETLPSRH